MTIKKKTVPHSRIHILKVLGLILGLFILLELLFMPQNRTQISYGVSFSPEYATYLGLDWKQAYNQILQDLGVQKLRLNTYWKELEPTEGQFNFAQTDYLLDQANNHNAKVILVVGYKQPRWPECHAPKWSNQLSLNQRRQKLLNYTEKVVSRYKNHPAVQIWQVENEPFFGFGEDCDPIDQEFLESEVNLVKRIDPTRQVMVTDSGEWSWWIKASKVSDILGVSVYRKAFNSQLNRYVNHPFPAFIYSLKYQIVRFLTPSNQRLIVSELQAEPWFITEPTKTPTTEQIKIFTIEDMESNLDSTQKINTSDIYLWGVEWWIYMDKKATQTLRDAGSPTGAPRRQIVKRPSRRTWIPGAGPGRSSPANSSGIPTAVTTVAPTSGRYARVRRSQPADGARLE